MQGRVAQGGSSRSWLWLGLALAGAVAISFAWSEFRRRELLGLLDRPPAITIQAEQWRLFYDRLLDSAFFTRLRESDAVKEILASPEGRRFLDLRGGFEMVLEEDPAQLFLRTFGRRLDGGIWLRPSGGFALGVVSLPEEGTDLDDVARRINVMAKSSPQEPSYEVEGLTVFPLGGDGVMVFSDEVAVLASHEIFGLTLARRWSERLRGPPAVEPGIHVGVGPEAWQGDLGETRFEEAFRTLGWKVLAGDMARVLEQTQNIALEIVPVERGIRAQARFDVGLDDLGPAEERYALDLGPEEPLLDAEFLRIEMSRDLHRFWAQREVHLSPDTLERLEREEADAGVSGLTQAAFEGLEPPFAVRMLNVEADDAGPPLPAAALVAGLRDAALAPRLEQVLELIFSRAGQDGDPGARVVLEPATREDDTRLRRIHIESPALADESGALQAWLDPVFASGEAQIVLASQPALASRLLGAPLPRPGGGVGSARDRIRIRAEPMRQALEAHIDLLVESQMRDRGIDRTQAERELRGVATILAGLDDARLEWTHLQQETVASLTVRGR